MQAPQRIELSALLRRWIAVVFLRENCLEAADNRTLWYVRVRGGGQVFVCYEVGSVDGMHGFSAEYNFVCLVGTLETDCIGWWLVVGVSV
jgi:hypothetical protein